MANDIQKLTSAGPETRMPGAACSPDGGCAHTASCDAYTPSPSGEKEWNAMVYLAGDNAALEEFMTKNVADMEKVGSNERMNVLVELDRGPWPSDTYGKWEGSRRFLIQKDDDPSKINSPVVSDLGRVDMSDPKHLTDFLVWAMKGYPAKHQLLILNNHGGGFTGSLEDDDPGGGKYMKIPDIARAVAEAEEATGKKIDIIGFDACLMGQAEVAYELRNVANIFMGAEELIDGDGMRYSEFLQTPVTSALAESLCFMHGTKDAEASKALSPEELASFIVKNTAKHQDIIPTMAAVKLGEAMDGLAKAADDLAAHLIQSIDEKKTDPEAFVRLIKGSQQFSKVFPGLKPYGDFRDLKDIAVKLGESTEISDPAVRDVAKNLVESFDRTVIAEQSKEDGYSGAHGLSIYAPATGGSDYGYSRIAWAADTRWDELFKKLGKMDPNILPPKFKLASFFMRKDLQDYILQPEPIFKGEAK